MTQPAARRQATRRVFDYVVLALAVPTYVAAGCLAWFHLTQGPPAQRVNVRWAATVSASERAHIEGDAGLVDGVQVDARTWQYLLRKRSRADIERLVTDARVEDTSHIDRAAFRVQLDRPDLSPRARVLLEFDLSGHMSVVLALAAAVMTLWSRRTLVAGVRAVTAGVSTVTAPGSPSAVHRRTVIGVVAATAIVLVLSASSQIYDSNFYAMTGATSLLAGDRIYRDFFEPGVPLAAYTAAGAQLVSGHRVIGEFVRQWLFILVGFGIVAHLGLRLSRSTTATLVMMALALLVLTVTPIYHHDKLFFFPLIVWACWHYIDRPTAARGAVCGCVTALAFLSRHDYGVYLGAASVGAFLLARLAVVESRPAASLIRDAAAYAIVVGVLLAPWAVSVQTSEGLVAYARSRAELFQGRPGFPYGLLLRVNPIRTFSAPPLPAPRPAAVTLSWVDSVNDVRRRQLEREYALGFIEQGAGGRWRYQVPNVYDSRLLGLNPYVNDTEGVPWDVLQNIRLGLPARENVVVWVEQMALLVPVVLLLVGGRDVWRSWRRSEAVPGEACRMTLAGGFLVVVDAALLREPSYVVVVVPLVAALSARFLVSRSLAMRACAMTLAAFTTVAALLWMRSGPLYASPAALIGSLQSDFSRLVTFPPDYGYLPFQYLRECTAPGDHVLVMGGTPLHVSYYAQRPIAGGHINWHHGWRSDPIHEAESLALLQRQSVPIALSTEDSVLDNFKRYPKIHAYLATYYAEVEGTGGFIMVDSRRRPTGRFGPMNFPCFR